MLVCTLYIHSIINGCNIDKTLIQTSPSQAKGNYHHGMWRDYTMPMYINLTMNKIPLESCSIWSYISYGRQWKFFAIRFKLYLYRWWSLLILLLSWHLAMALKDDHGISWPQLVVYPQAHNYTIVAFHLEVFQGIVIYFIPKDGGMTMLLL